MDTRIKGVSSLMRRALVIGLGGSGGAVTALVMKKLQEELRHAGLEAEQLNRYWRFVHIDKQAPYSSNHPFEKVDTVETLGGKFFPLIRESDRNYGQILARVKPRIQGAFNQQAADFGDVFSLASDSWSYIKSFENDYPPRSPLLRADTRMMSIDLGQEIFHVLKTEFEVLLGEETGSEPPKVFIVSSLSGATGSVLVADIVHLAQLVASGATVGTKPNVVLFHKRPNNHIPELLNETSAILEISNSLLNPTWPRSHEDLEVLSVDEESAMLPSVVSFIALPVRVEETWRPEPEVSDILCGLVLETKSITPNQDLCEIDEDPKSYSIVLPNAMKSLVPLSHLKDDEYLRALIKREEARPLFESLPVTMAWLELFFRGYTAARITGHLQDSESGMLQVFDEASENWVEFNVVAARSLVGSGILDRPIRILEAMKVTFFLESGSLSTALLPFEAIAKMGQVFSAKPATTAERRKIAPSVWWSMPGCEVDAETIPLVSWLKYGETSHGVKSQLKALRDQGDFESRKQAILLWLQEWALTLEGQEADHQGSTLLSTTRLALAGLIRDVEAFRP